MILLLVGKIKIVETWIALLQQNLPHLEIRLWPEVGDPSEIEIILAGFDLAETLPPFPHLKLVISIGAGVDHILKNTNWMGDAAVVRVVSNSLTAQMVEYITLAVLTFQRRLIDYLALKNTQQWQYLPTADAGKFTVGILGLGVLGSAVATQLQQLEFPVRGWSRTPKTLAGINCFAEPDQFHAFLSECRVLICLLPLTPETRGILNLTTFSALPQGAFLINVARGNHLVEADLLTALNSGQIGAAWLDVFQTEPLPKNHAFWLDERIIITPHIAAVTLPSEVIPQVIDAIDCYQMGQPLKNRVDLHRGY
jgi:glyoxylate/hydroxypyruvate reductase A